MIDVLLIDQENLFQKAFRKIMDGIENCRLVGVAETCDEAMSLFNSYRPQVVFADAVVGQESGISICRRIKELAPSTLVYILTNYCNLNLMKNWMCSGLDEYLLKPVSRDRISSLVLANARPVAGRGEEYARDLINAIDCRDYKKAYGLVQTVTDRVFSEGSRESRRDLLEGIAASLMYQIPGMDKTQMSYYLQKFELTGRILERKILICGWLTDLCTEVFRQLCVFKYTHMNQALQYIESHINYEIPITELAAKAGISSGYLSRIFKKYYHISVVDYIHLRKIHKAKQYMISSDMNISDISFLLGYSEAGYFCKVFKKYEGMTPSAFMNQYTRRAA